MAAAFRTLYLRWHLLQLSGKFRQLDLQRAADSLRIKSMARSDFHFQLHLVPFHRRCQRRRRTMFPMPHSPTTVSARFVQSRQFQLRHSQSFHLELHLRISNPSNMKKLTNGWGVNGIVTIQAGQPFGLNYNFQDDYDGSGEFFGPSGCCRSYSLFQRPSQLPGPDFVCSALYSRRHQRWHIRSKLASLAPAPETPCTLV